MDIVEKLNEIGIVAGGAADVLLDSKKQLSFFKQYSISPQTDKITKYQCVIGRNNGERVYRSPIVGFSDSSLLQAASLQVGIFTLLQFEHIAPLLPTSTKGHPNRVKLNLFSIPESSFNIESLVSEYNLERVYDDFLKMHDENKVSQDAFLKEFERRKSIARKAAKVADNSVEINQESEPSMMLEEIADSDLAKQVAEILELQKQKYEQEENPDPLARSSEEAEQPESPEQPEPPEPPVLRDPAQETITQRDDKISEDREEQFFVIQEAVYILGYDPLNIADGGRGEIEKFCLKDKGLFTESGFRQAWDEALKQGIVHDDNASSETWAFNPEVKMSSEQTAC